MIAQFGYLIADRALPPDSNAACAEQGTVGTKAFRLSGHGISGENVYKCAPA